MGKTEQLKCQIDDGCDGWSLDTLPPPNRAKNGNFHFHKIIQTAVVVLSANVLSMAISGAVVVIYDMVIIKHYLASGIPACYIPEF